MDEVALETCGLLLDRWEGEHLEAYLCPANVWTISKGATFYPDGTEVKEGDTITAEQSAELTRILVEAFCEKIIDFVAAPEWRSGERLGAITSLAYNIGVSAFIHSTVLERINLGASNEDIAEAWGWWKKAGGKTLRGLVLRREHECQVAGLI